MTYRLYQRMVQYCFNILELRGNETINYFHLFAKLPADKVSRSK